MLPRLNPYILLIWTLPCRHQSNSYAQFYIILDTTIICLTFGIVHAFLNHVDLRKDLFSFFLLSSLNLSFKELMNFSIFLALVILGFFLGGDFRFLFFFLAAASKSESLSAPESELAVLSTETSHCLCILRHHIFKRVQPIL